MDLDTLSASSYSLFECGAVFVNDEAGARAHPRACDVCQRYIRQIQERRAEELAAPYKIVLTDA